MELLKFKREISLDETKKNILKIGFFFFSEQFIKISEFNGSSRKFSLFIKIDFDLSFKIDLIFPNNKISSQTELRKYLIC